MNNTSDAPPKVERLQRLGVYVSVILAALLIGFVPMWLRAQTLATERDAATHALRRTTSEHVLASAAILARRGDYEPAREAASSFYTDLRAELDRADSVLSPSQREMVQPLLAQRDQVITLLARADPSAAERLSETYVMYRQAMGTLPRQ